jgi:hypothetical protein
LWPSYKTATFTPYELSGFTASVYGTDNTNKSNDRWHAEFAGSDMKAGFYGDRTREEEGGRERERERERETKIKKTMGRTKK